MTMIHRSYLFALFAAPLLGACPIDGDIGDGGDDANDSADDGGDAGDDAGDGGEAGDAGEDDAGDAGEDDAGDAGEGDDAGEEGGEEGGESGGSDDGGEPCDTEEECGPAPGAPNYLCPDGVNFGGPGPCQELEGGECGYPILECPPCCNPVDEPLCFEGATCCADGTWACNDGGGGSTCESGEGLSCACCDPAEGEALGCIEGASCCADGSWACNNGAGQSTCEQDGMVCEGASCQDDGATCAGGEECCDGLQCCSGVPVPPGEEYCSAECPISDRERKENFAEIDPNAVLDTLLKVPLSSWNYKFEDDSIRHVGPMAQDFKAAFEVGATDKAIYTIDADGVSFASIKALHGQLEGLRSENVELRKTLAAMQTRLDKLEKK